MDDKTFWILGIIWNVGLTGFVIWWLLKQMKK